jgi:hypothetical protein
MEGKGTETARLTLGGFWLTCDEKGMMKDKEFMGQGVMGFNSHEEVRGFWVDNMSPIAAKLVGEADSSGKPHLQVHDDRGGRRPEERQGCRIRQGQGQGHVGKEMKCSDKMVHEIKDQDHRTPALREGRLRQVNSRVGEQLHCKPAMIK